MCQGKLVPRWTLLYAVTLLTSDKYGKGSQEWSVADTFCHISDEEWGWTTVAGTKIVHVQVG